MSTTTSVARIKTSDRFRHADILIDCKQAIQASYRYLVYQLTCAGMNIPEFLEHWDCVLDNVDALLNRNQIE